MNARLFEIIRHPIKAVGRETLVSAILTPGEVLPWDRAYAIAHDRARADDLAGPWAKGANYLRGVTGPSLMAVRATFDETNRHITLRHPDQADLSVDLNTQNDALIDWLTALWPADISKPTHVVHHAGRAQTDMPGPWISINSRSSHAAVAEKLGADDLSIHRWRGNLWLDGLPPWAEFAWVGRQFRIGAAVLEGMQPITRCKATMANPETGMRDLDTLDALDAGWGHRDFGIYARVVAGGSIAPGDGVEVLG